MSERFTRLYALPENLHMSGAPILIVAGALLKDGQDNRVLVQLKLQNLEQSPLVACKVSIKAFDPSGAEVSGIESHTYLDLAVPRGDNFGSKVPIYLPNNTTRNISVSVIQAVFEDKTVWQNLGGKWEPISESRQQISDTFCDTELQKQYALEVGGNCEYVPVVVDDLFLCTCGAINLSKDKVCYKCNRNTADLLAALNLAELTKKKDARLAQEALERQEQERKAEEDRKVRERRAEEKHIAVAASRKKVLKYTTTLGIIAVIGIAVVTVYNRVIIPENKYKAAENLLEDRNYDGAISLFSELGDYKDSSERIQETKYIELEEKYKLAEELFKLEDYDGAISIFLGLGDYKDSPSRVQEIKYELAKKLLLDCDYEAAITIFTQLRGYKDSKDQIIICEEARREQKYKDALKAYDENDFYGALVQFQKLGGYSDSQIKYEEIECTLLSNASIGDTVYFGRYNEEPLAWNVINIQDEKVLLRTAKSIGMHQYNNSISESVTWEACTLRRYLNNSFFSDTFSTNEQMLVVETELNNECHTDNFNLDPAINIGGENTVDKIFIFSRDELFQFFNAKSSEQSSFISDAGYPGEDASGAAWLRTPDVEMENIRVGIWVKLALIVHDDGSFGKNGKPVTEFYDVLPAMWIDSSKVNK